MGCRAPDTRTADVLATGAGVRTVGELLRRVGRSTRTVRGGPEGHWSSAARSIQTQPRRKVSAAYTAIVSGVISQHLANEPDFSFGDGHYPASISLLTGMFLDRFTP